MIQQLKPWNSLDVNHSTRVMIGMQRATEGRTPLSCFLGGVKNISPCEVVALETMWERVFDVKHALAVNSATSGILAALKACGAGPGTEVICSPYSMSAGVAAIVWCGAKPSFTDIDNSLSLSPTQVDARLKEIKSSNPIVLHTNLFGSCQNLMALHDVCTRAGAYLIEDNAQGPFARAHPENAFGGTVGDVGVFSLNVHKPIQCGEGGICVTNNDDLADKIDGIRNHGELRGLPPGLNLRMTEVTAAIAIEQLAKGPEIVAHRNRLAKRLTGALKGMRSLIIPPYDPRSAYYIWHCTTMPSYREELVNRLQTRGVPVKAGYVQPLHLMPAFSQFTCPCPVTETIESEIITLEMYAWDLNESLIDQIAEAFWESAR